MTARSIRGNSSASGILSPRSHDPDTVYAGVEDAALFRSTDGAQTWHELAGLRGHGTGPQWQPGAGGMGLHTILLDPKDPKRIYIAISAAGAFRTDDGGATWKPINQGLRSQYIPDPNAEVGHCVHHMALHASRPDVLFMQKHWDVMRSDDAGDLWKEVSGNLPTDFGFAIDVHAHEPETIYVVPIKSDSEHFPLEGRAARLPQPHGRQRVGAAQSRSAAARLLRQRAAGRHGRRSTRFLRRLFRNHRRTGVRFRPTPETTGRPSCEIFRPCCPWKCRRWREGIAPRRRIDVAPTLRSARAARKGGSEMCHGRPARDGAWPRRPWHEGRATGVLPVMGHGQDGHGTSKRCRPQGRRYTFNRAIGDRRYSRRTEALPLSPRSTNVLRRGAEKIQE